MERGSDDWPLNSQANFEIKNCALSITIIQSQHKSVIFFLAPFKLTGLSRQKCTKSVAGATITFKSVGKAATFYLFFAFFPSPLKMLSKTQVIGRVIVLSDILQQLSESSSADWSRAMVYESIHHRNDVTCM